MQTIIQKARVALRFWNAVRPRLQNRKFAPRRLKDRLDRALHAMCRVAGRQRDCFTLILRRATDQHPGLVSTGFEGVLEKPECCCDMLLRQPYTIINPAAFLFRYRYYQIGSLVVVEGVG